MHVISEIKYKHMHADAHRHEQFGCICSMGTFKTCVLRLERDTVKCLHQLMLEIKEKDDESLVFVYQKPQISSVLCCLYLFLQ